MTFFAWRHARLSSSRTVTLIKTEAGIAPTLTGTYERSSFLSEEQAKCVARTFASSLDVPYATILSNLPCGAGSIESLTELGPILALLWRSIIEWAGTNRLS